MREETIFVFYTLFPNSEEFNVPVIENWEWIGSGTTYPFYRTNTLRGCCGYLCSISSRPIYKREMQFDGPSETKQQAFNSLNNFFRSLKERNIVKIYKLEYTFNPY